MPDATPDPMDKLAQVIGDQTAENMSAETDGDLDAEDASVTVAADWHAAQMNLRIVLLNLPYGQAVGEPPLADPMVGAVDWVTQVGLWMQSYRWAIEAAERAAAGMRTELAELRAQREAVQTFFGTRNVVHHVGRSGYNQGDR